MSETAPSAWIVRFSSLVPAGSRVLDVACGGGRHSAWFAAAGHPVLAVDRDIDRVAALGLAGVTVVAADLEAGGPVPWGSEGFGGVVVTNYLYRPLLPALVTAVAPRGVLLYETFGQDNERVGGRVRNPDYLLRHGELLEVVAGRLRVVAYEDVVEAESSVGPAGAPAAVQRICAVNAPG